MASAPPPLPPGFVLAQPGAAPQQRRVIEGPPREPPPQTVAAAQGDVLQNQERELNIARLTREASEAAAQQARNRSQVGDARSEIQAVIEAARRAQQRSRNGWFQTGIGADWIGSNTPEGRALRGDLDVIGSNTAFSRLQQMRADSPTGGALGSITERELALLQSTVASLDPGQSDADFQRNMDTIIQRYQGILDRLPADEARPQQQTESGQAARPEGQVMFNDEARPTPPPNLTPEQASAYDAFHRANPNATAEQLSAFGQSIGITINNADEIVRARDSGAGVLPGSEGRGGRPEADISAARGNGAPGEGIDAFARGAADVVSLGLADEIAAGGDTLFNGGSYGENLYRQRGIDRYDQENNFGSRLTGQLAGGLLLPTFGARGVGQNALVGTGYGAGYGFGSGEGDLADRGGNALIGGTIGGGIGAGVGRIGNALARRAEARLPAQETMQAAQRQGVDVLPADVGGPMTRRLTAGAAQMPFASGPIARAANTANEAAGAARDRAAATIGAAAEPEAAGEAARRGALSFIRRTSGRGSELYTRAERAAGDARIAPARAIEALDQNIAELSQVPGGAEGLQALQMLRQELDGEFTVSGIRQMRTALRDRFISSGLRGSDVERRINQVIDAASEDVFTGLARQGRGEAARAYQAADRYWRNRLRTIDDVLNPILGDNRSGEEIVGALQRAARGNTRQLQQFIGSLPPEESAVVRATIIGQLGRPSAGTDTGATFSLNQFLTHYNQMQPRARRVLFGDAAPALDDLATIARGTRQSQGYANRSNTGGAGNVASILGGLGSLGTTIPLEMITGRMLASPAFARWLAGSSRTRNPRLHIRGLATIASRNPAIAQEVTGLQRALMQAANDNSAVLTRSAASSGPEAERND